MRGLQLAPPRERKHAEIDGGVLANRALRLQEEGRLEEAVAVFLHAIPMLQNALLNLGRAHQHLGDARSAFMAYDQAASIFGAVGDQAKHELACRWRAEQRVRCKESSC
jgi:tetratricopeptide (TPR) repeat protein